jgi:protein tyrosine/serine phosphatase
MKRLKDEHAASIVPLQALEREAAGLERQVSDLLNEAFGLTPEDVRLMWDTAPPRMPLARAAEQKQLSRASRVQPNSLGVQPIVCSRRLQPTQALARAKARGYPQKTRVYPRQPCNRVGLCQERDSK